MIGGNQYTMVFLERIGKPEKGPKHKMANHAIWML